MAAVVETVCTHANNANTTHSKVQCGDVSVVVNYAREDDIQVSMEEIRAYISRGNQRNSGSSLVGLQLDVDGDYVGIHYEYDAAPFDRIRRITGYLVGTLDRFNDGKRAEERDRVKHSLPKTCC